MATHLYWHPDIFLHDQAAQHCAMEENRIARIFSRLSAVEGAQPVLATPASTDVFRLVHSDAYVDHLLSVAPTQPGQRHAFDSETIMNEHTLGALQLSAGAVCQAVDAVLQGSAQNAFCAVYAGHHADAQGAQGFCFTNQVAIAGKYALAKGVQKLAILDIDTHSGNGTIMAFWEPDERVIFAETHQPGYPGAFMPPNKPPHILRRKCTHPAYFMQYWKKMLAQVKEFGPELILVSAGFDAHKADPLSAMGLSDVHYQQLAQEILAVSPRVVATLEGGYNLDSASRCAALFMTEMVKKGMTQ